ncbi:NAD(P)-binding protein [Streptomyces sp. Ac-502]|uniref:NAD(P)-binding protein n=1 Tax=Streptomyces sp. Ac-502 TaxID=3342801 RepID=UPI003862C378
MAEVSAGNGPGRPERVGALVVGSGFGGSVAAYRLAEAGLSVVVLERGRAYPPGSFPRTPAELGRALWDPSEGLYGLFDVWRFGGCDSLVSSGLGGGSLIYANVLLRKEPRWFVRREELPGGGHECWPLTRADLDPHYDAVESVLRPVPYPVDTEPYARTPKTRALREAAGRAGLPWSPAPLAVSFAPAPARRPPPVCRWRTSRTAVSTACRAAPAGSPVSATWAATTARRTPSTTPICPPRATTAPTCGPGTRP